MNGTRERYFLISNGDAKVGLPSIYSWKRD